MSENLILLNGTLFKEKDAPPLLLDRGLLFGDGIFESMRAIRGKILGFEYHLERLFQGLRTLKISPTWNKQELQGEVQKLIQESTLEDCYLRVNVTRGKWLGSIPPIATSAPSLLIICRKFLPLREELYTHGFHTLILATRRNETSPLCQVKSLNYLDNILGRMAALEQGMDEGLFLNSKGFLTEGTASNLFLVQGNRLLTPPPEDGVLPGITRKIILENAPVLPLKVEIRSIRPQEIFQSDEGFLTNASMGIVPWVECDGRKIGQGERALTQRIRSLYQNLLVSQSGVS